MMIGPTKLDYGQTAYSAISVRSTRFLRGAELLFFSRIPVAVAIRIRVDRFRGMNDRLIYHNFRVLNFETLTVRIAATTVVDRSAATAGASWWNGQG